MREVPAVAVRVLVDAENGALPSQPISRRLRIAFGILPLAALTCLNIILDYSMSLAQCPTGARRENLPWR
jgi:hypothetical protein